MITIDKPIVELPFTNTPTVRSYNNIAFPIGIMEANAKTDITPWLCSLFINCRFTTNSEIESFNTCLVNGWDVAECSLIHQTISLLKESCDFLELDIMMLLKKMISKQNYVADCMNEKYIPGKAAYGKYDFVHDNLIFGYNDEKSVFLAAGYLANGKFEKFEIKYDDYMKSIAETKRDRIKIHFWKFNNNHDYCLQMNWLKNDLNDYILSRNSNRSDKDTYYGIEAIRKLSDYFEDVVKTSDYPYLDMRYTRALMENKYLMYLRIKYLTNQGILNGGVPVDVFEKNYQKAQMIHMLALKLNSTGNKSIINKISVLFDEILTTEEPLLRGVYEQIS